MEIPRAESPAVPGLKSLWDATLGDPRICIAVLDGPVDLCHPSLAGARLTVVETVVPNDAGPNTASRHGTHVASVIFGQPGSSVAGVAPRCRGLLIPIYRAGRGETLACSQLELARAIDQAVAQGAMVINISGGQLASSGAAEPMLVAAIRRCSEHGVLIVAAAGNNGCRCLHIPAAVPSVLAVGAMDAEGTPLAFSNWGDAYQAQGVLALGSAVRGAVPGDGTAERSGTSFATPLVSGIAGLLLSLQLARGGNPDAASVRTALLETAEPCHPGLGSECARWLTGRLNLPAATARVAGYGERVGGAEAGVGGALPASAPGAQPTQDLEPAARPDPQDRDGRAPPEGASLDIFPAPVFRKLGRKRPHSDHNNPLVHESERTETLMPDETQTLMPEPQTALAGVVDAPDSPPPGRVLASQIADRAEETTAPDSPPAPPPIPGAIEASACASCAAEARAQTHESQPGLVYALGQIGYDFGTEARRDSFIQQTGRNVHDSAQLLESLQQDPASAANLIWTLSLDATVVYAIQPIGAFASQAYDRLREALQAQLTEGVERVSVPGYLRGSTRLLNGQQVPVILPQVRGMYSWSTPHLVKAVVGAAPKAAAAAEEHAAKAAGIQNFLERIYYEVRNLGITSQDRAMNFAATNAFQLEFVYTEAIKGGLKLDTIAVERSPICRPGSDCWDVKLTFFHPAKRLEQARHVHRFTVDVSDVVPVTVGKVRHWDVY
ncbi:MAG: S8 family serine peptidase [Verrucomicrobiales bacterium]|nr:S8 family serine peptidase [Verrucomicrobiales bacterium]